MVRRPRLRRLLTTTACAAAVAIGALTSAASTAPAATVVGSARVAVATSTPATLPESQPVAISSVVAVHYANVDVKQPTSPNSACAITEYGYTGYRICGFDYSSVNYGNGNVEYFVVGTNYAIWHIWSGSRGWHSLGGVANSAGPGVYAFIVSGDTVIDTVGTDNYWWCNDRSSTGVVGLAPLLETPIHNRPNQADDETQVGTRSTSRAHPHTQP